MQDTKCQMPNAKCKREWTAGRISLWLVVASVIGLWQGPSFVQSLRPPRHLIQDFFQDWASARLYWDGLPVYTSQETALEKYLGYHRQPDEPVWNEVNAHPPTSILLYLPLAQLDYPEALLAWNLLALLLLVGCVVLLIRQLAMPFSGWSLLPLVSLLLICCPLREQFLSGQPNVLLLLLIAGSWAAERSGHGRRAGVLLGAATAIKLFPGLLFIYFLLQRRRQALLAGAATVLGLTLATALVLGPGTYWDYVADVLPHVGGYRSSWGNASLAAFWSRLFDPAARSGNMVPLSHQPALARCGIVFSCGLIVAALSWLTVRSRSRAACDQAFGLGAIAMLLVCPITWNHYFVILGLPLAILWVYLPASRWARGVFGAGVACLWIPPDLFWCLFMGVPVGMWMKSLASPWQSATVLSVQLYALLALFALGVSVHRRLVNQSAPSQPAGTDTLGNGFRNRWGRGQWDARKSA